ncbi:MAG TPA: hypothetical protein PLK46_06665 [Propioniciclava sp.]|jgi:type III secretory pathway component EscS|uniref:hypothetical protein n=1 Tax=Propioniciclava sp. TaxID=2038686 RepID=UPI002B57A8AB|nr:hypothetical protein [Propioniciclava sp.]HRL48429.1 hypothetical protein [Propioniciclava sp.]HRL79995.1 hypothetical protein [Propioniciclava sp.]
MAERGKPSDNVLRAQRLLVAGLVGGHIAAFTSVGLFWALAGADAGITAAIAAAATIAFYAIALGAQVIVADAAPKVVLFAWLASYLARVTVLGLALAVTLTQAQRFTWLDPIALVVTTIAVVLGWICFELYAYSRLRIPVFDPPPA